MYISIYVYVYLTKGKPQAASKKPSQSATQTKDEIQKLITEGREVDDKMSTCSAMIDDQEEVLNKSAEAFCVQQQSERKEFSVEAVRQGFIYQKP